MLPVLEAELGPGVAEALARSADLLRSDADLLDALAMTAGQDVATGESALDCVRLAALPDALRSRVLLAWLRELGAHDLTARHVAAVDALVTAWRGQGTVDLPGVRVVRADGLLRGPT